MESTQAVGVAVERDCHNGFGMGLEGAIDDGATVSYDAASLYRHRQGWQIKRHRQPEKWRIAQRIIRQRYAVGRGQAEHQC